jgi:hypothetical protein
LPPTGGRTILDVLAVALVVAGTSLAGIVPTWRGAVLGLGLQYLGVAIVLFTMSGPAAGVVAVVTAAGIEAIVGLDQGISFRDGALLTSLFSDVDLANGQALALDPDRPHRRVRRQAGLAALPIRWFDVSVIALAIVGALGVAIGRITFGSFGADAVVGVLTLTGLLYCLLGSSARLTSGLLFLGSAAGVLSRVAGAPPSPIEPLLVAATQVALAVALVFLRAFETSLANASRRGAELKALPDSVEPAVASAEVDLLT